jgi:putative transposase
MARALRIEFENALYHVTSRGNEKRSIFRTDRDRKSFLSLVGEVATRYGWSVTAYVLMSNHFHLVIQTPQANLSRGMQWLNGTYAGRFNRVHKRSGHLFQGRFHAFLIEKEAYFAEVLRYTVLNPVRANMVARPEEYRWSSYRATAGLEVPPQWLDVHSALQMFDPDTVTAHAEYRSFVHAKVESDERLWDDVTNAIYLGTTSWAKEMRKLVESKPRSTDHPKKHRAIGRPTMQEVIASVAQVAELPRDVVRSIRGGPLRNLAAWVGWNEGLLTLRSIAASFRLRSEGHVSGLVRRCQRDLGRDRELLAQMDSVIALLRA